MAQNNKMMSKLDVLWYNARFNFAYWLLGAKSMKVTRRRGETDENF